MNEQELYLAALRRAPNMGESREVRALRDFTHAEMIAGRIAGATQDRIRELIDALASKETPRVGDLIGGPNVTDIRWDVLEVTNVEGERWRRALGADRYSGPNVMPGGTKFDWVNLSWYTGNPCDRWCATGGLLEHWPLTVTKVASREPAEPHPPPPDPLGEDGTRTELTGVMGPWLRQTSKTGHAWALGELVVDGHRVAIEIPPMAYRHVGGILREGEPITLTGVVDRRSDRALLSVRNGREVA